MKKESAKERTAMFFPRFRDISLKWKLNLSGIIIIFFFSLIVYFMVLPLLKEEKIIEREGKLKAVVTSVVSLMDFYEHEIRNQSWRNDPSMPRSIDEAKKLVLREIRHMRYDKTEFFFILDGDGFMVMHPFKPEYEGKNMFDNKDRTGPTPFKDMTINAQRDGECFVKYSWHSKWSADVFEPQTTFAKYFWPWDWIVCSGVYTQDIIDSVQETTINATGYIGAATVLALMILYILGRFITKPISQLSNEMKKITTSMQFEEIEIHGNDEIGSLGTTFNFMINEIKGYSQNLEGMNRELQRLDKLKDEFLANTSHELRTPLNGIIGLAESLIEGATGALPNRTVHNLEMIAASGRRLTNLVNDILDFSRLRHKDINLQKRPIDLFTITDVVLELSSSLVSSKNLELLNTVPEQLSAVYADENRVLQILHNLVGNAIKFTESGSITVSAREENNGFITISVSDTGIGIPSDRQKSIFSSFEQADGSIEREYGGTGLGLTVSKHLIELHGGSIGVDSEPGAGSRFYFSLPASEKKAEPAAGLRYKENSPVAALHEVPDTIPVMTEPETEAVPEEPELEPPYNILIVDDEPINLQVLSNQLSLRNYSVTKAANGIEALEMVELREDAGSPFDIVLLDVMMPRMSGYEVCKRLRETYPAGKLPILMLTAKNQVEDMIAGMEAGANDYLAKPFSGIELLSRVKTHLALKTLFDEQKRIEEALRQSEGRLQSILDNTISVIYLKDINGNYIAINKQFEHLFAVSRDNISGKSDYTIFPETIARKFRSNDLLVISQNRALEFEEQAPNEDGIVHTYLSIKFPLHDSSGNIYCTCGISTDITDRKLAEVEVRVKNEELEATNEELQAALEELEATNEEFEAQNEELIISQQELEREEKRLRTILEQLPFPVLLSKFNKIDYLNNIFTTTFGYTLKDFPGIRQLWSLFFPDPKYRQEIYSEYMKNMKTISSGEIIEFGPIKMTCSDQRILDVEFKITVVDDIILTIFNDVTERLKMHDTMIQTEKMMTVGGLAAGMAHEINNPLGVILQGIQVSLSRLSPDLQKNRETAADLNIDLELIRSYLTERGIFNYLEGMREAGSRAAKIVSNMLQFSRRSDSRIAPCDINTLIDNTIEIASKDYDFKKKYDFRKINIIRDFKNTLAPVPCIETEIEQVILNLLKNSAHAMAEKQDKDSSFKPEISISTGIENQDDKKFAIISISDNGPGIDADSLKHIFEPFYTTKGVGAGTGLGLSVSYFIITNNHKGIISADSIPGEGARFNIKLPVETGTAR